MKVRAIVFALLLALAAPTWAEVSALMVPEPTERKDSLMLSRLNLEGQLGRAIGQSVKATESDDLTDAMRATRSAGFDVFIAPPQVTASALAHGYELVGNTDVDDQYVLVAKAGIATTAGLRRGRLYLPQQDSIYTYLARGLLNANGLSFKDMHHVEYTRYPQVGLTAIGMNLAEATVVRRADWDAWSKANPGVAAVVASSGPVPGGLCVAVKKALAPELRVKVAKWFGESAGSFGMKPVALRSEAATYKRVAELGAFTPNALPGATVVDVQAVKRLLSQGAVLVDTRNEQEFKQAHIEGARFVPYHEKSLKDVAYDATLDDFAGLATLDKTQPTIFHCNGAECWKSYKASRAALAAGFTKVYWFRGGMPEWSAAAR